MRATRLVLVLAATAVAVVLCEAQFQPPGAVPVTPMPLAVALLGGIDDPVVVAELKLKDDQLKTLVARRQALWDEAYVTAPKKLAESAVERDKATDELLRKTLNAEQYKRAVQLAAQSQFRAFGGPDGEPTVQVTRVSGTALNRYPELADVLKLTDEQKKQLTPAKGGKGKGSPSIPLSKDQVATAKDFLGTVAKTWTAKPAPWVADRPLPPTNFYLLEAKDVRADLKLAEAEGKTLLDLGDEWTKLNAARQTDLSPKEADARAAKLKAETEKAMAALTPKQVQRLKQIDFQTSRGFGGGFAGGGSFAPTSSVPHIESSYAIATVAKELVITQEQTKEFVAIRDAFRKDAAAVLESAADSAAAGKKLDALVAARQKKAEAVLKAEQAARWKEIVGEPFTGSTRPDRLPAGFGGRLMSEAERVAWFGRHTFADFGLLAANQDVQKALGMDEKQVKTAGELRDAISAKFPARPSRPGEDDAAEAKVIADRSNMIAEEIARLLDAKQAKRFREIMLQYWEQTDRLSPRTGMVYSAVAYPGVAEAVKLTEPQKKRLIAGDAPAEVLTDAQKTAIQGMLGAKYEGSLVIGGPGGRPVPVGGSLQPSPAGRALLGANAAEVEESLKLTDEQKKKLAAAREAYQKVLAGPDFPALAERRAAAEAFDKALADIFKPEQQPRLAQIALQTEAAANLLAAITREDVAKKLNLTKEQTDKLAAVDRDSLELHQLRTTHVGRTSPAAEDNLGLRMRNAGDERLMAVLSDAQKKTWNELIGEPLKGLRKTIPTGRFPGGFGGGGGLGGGGGFVPPGGFGP